MFDGLVDTIKGWVASFIEYTLWRIFHFIEIVLVRFVALVEDVMEVFTGESMVKYEKKDMYLINVFFEHKAVRGIYGGMALIGIVFCFVFAIVSVIRRALDLRDKQQGLTMGIILGNLLKSILIICSMNLIMLVAIETTNTLIKTVSWTIQNGEALADPAEITFTDEQYAAMGRIINTIGNYSLNPSYKSRYNLNACYNDIRGDLKYLGDQGVFNFHYVTKNKSTGQEVETWQSLMEELATAYNYENEAPLDEYHDGRTSAILDAIEILQANPTMEVLKYYKRDSVEIQKYSDVPMDRILFLIGTMGLTDDVAAARNPEFNKNPSFFDNARLPFYLGEEGADIYNYDDVRKVFDPSPFSTNYILVWFSSIAILKEMLVLIVTCAVRIFNLLTLYIAAPLAIAVMPLDDGGKFKQWITAFIVQLLTILGMVIAIRLFLMFIPIIWSPALKTSSNSLLDVIIKMVIQYGAVLSVNKVNGIFTGILADNAGFQAITAGDVRSNVENSSAGKMLEGMSAGAQAEKGFNKGRGALGKGLGKVSTTAAYVSDMVGLTEGAYENSSKRQKEQARSEGDQKMLKDRNQQRQTKALEKDLNHLKTTGSHLDGRTPKNEAQKKHEVSKMEKTLAHMKEGDSFKDASRKAKMEMMEDKKDQELEGKIKAMELKNPPPKRQPAPQKKEDNKSSKQNNGPEGQRNNSHADQPNNGPGGRRQQPPEAQPVNHNNVVDNDDDDDNLPNNQGHQVPPAAPQDNVNDQNNDNNINLNNNINNPVNNPVQAPDINQPNNLNNNNPMGNNQTNTTGNNQPFINIPQGDMNTTQSMLNNAGYNVGNQNNPNIQTSQNNSTSQTGSQTSMDNNVLNQTNQNNQVGPGMNNNPMGNNQTNTTGNNQPFINIPQGDMNTTQSMLNNAGYNVGSQNNPNIQTSQNNQTGMDNNVLNQTNQNNQVGPGMNNNPMGNNQTNTTGNNQPFINIPQGDMNTTQSMLNNAGYNVGSQNNPNIQTSQNNSTSQTGSQTSMDNNVLNQTNQNNQVGPEMNNNSMGNNQTNAMGNNRPFINIPTGNMDTTQNMLNNAGYNVGSQNNPNIQTSQNNSTSQTGSQTSMDNNILNQTNQNNQVGPEMNNNPMGNNQTNAMGNNQPSINIPTGDMNTTQSMLNNAGYNVGSQANQNNQTSQNSQMGTNSQMDSNNNQQMNNQPGTINNTTNRMNQNVNSTGNNNQNKDNRLNNNQSNINNNQLNQRNQKNQLGDKNNPTGKK